MIDFDEIRAIAGYFDIIHVPKGMMLFRTLISLIDWSLEVRAKVLCMLFLMEC